jgi:hypothetical protein
MLLKPTILKPLLRATVVLGLVVGWAKPAPTQDHPASFLGSWAGLGRGEVTATVRKHEARPGHFLAEIQTASGACAGLIEVTGQLGEASVATAEPPYDGGPVCEIEFRLVAPDRLNLVEMGDCTYAHGFRCGFTSELTRSGT